jgi:crotonobetainyl-CoA:carnitine CoA-transferase CaiB-like acyl-CoA transferase
MSVMELQVVVLPRLMQVIDGDSNAALGALAALALGAYHAKRTGEGQHLRTSMIAGNAWAYSDDFCRFEGKRPAAGTGEDFVGVTALDHLYQAADRSWLCVHVETDSEFAALAEQLGGGLEDERFRTPEGRAEHDADLTKILTSLFASAPAVDWETKLVPAGVGCVELSLGGMAVMTAFDPRLREAGLTTTIDHPLFGTLVRAAPPVSFSESAGRVDLPCLRGEHNRALLEWLGYDEPSIADFESRDIVIPPVAVEPLPAHVR